MRRNLHPNFEDYLCIALDETTTTRRRRGSCCGRCSPPGQACPRSPNLKKRHRASDPPALAAPAPTSRTRCSTPTTPRPGCCATSAPAVRQGPGAGPQHDPAGQLHHELNATSEMIPSPGPSSPTCTRSPRRPAAGYAQLDAAAARWLCQATGYAGISLQPNAGSQGRIRRPAGHQGLPRESGR